MPRVTQAVRIPHKPEHLLKVRPPPFTFHPSTTTFPSPVSLT